MKILITTVKTLILNCSLPLDVYLKTALHLIVNVLTKQRTLLYL